MYNRKEFLELIGLSNQTLKRMIKAEEIKPIKEKGKTYFTESDLSYVLDKYKDRDADKTKEFEDLINKHYGYKPYEFLSEYKGISEYIEVKCLRCNNKFKVTPGNIKNNMRLGREPYCKTCGLKKVARDNTLSKDDYVKQLDNYKDINEYIVGDDYVNTSTKCSHTCKKCNYTFKATPSNVLYSLKSNRLYCPSCNNLRRSELDYSVKLRRYTGGKIKCIGGYKGRKIKTLHKCNICGYEWEAVPNNRLKKYGNGCPKCSNKINQSNAEKEVIEFLNENNISFIEKDRKTISPKEIDILIPSKNIGIEINGNYWHSEKYKGKKYHLEKTEKCKEKGIQLIHIFEDEWYDKKDIIKSKLKHLLNIKDDITTVYARKCYIEEIDNIYKTEFLNKNHIQGNDTSNIRLGLWYKDKNGDDLLLGVMTFCKPRASLGQKQNSEYDYELSRFAIDIEYNVPGGFSKLLTYFIRNYQWNKIITYADKRYSQGKVYTNNNFTHLRDSKPNYWYVNKNTKKKYHRYTFRKQVLKEKFPNFYDPNKTEFEIMDKTEYFRVWDCGNMVFEYKKIKKK